MTLEEIFQKLGSLEVSEERCRTYEYGELVFYREEEEKWNNMFTDILGPAVKLPGAKPTREDQLLTQDYGGIRYDQTLFKKDFGDSTVVAMFWPWQDKVHVTLKIILLKGQPQ